MPLRDYQQYAVDACENFLLYGSGNGYVTCAGGGGKSHIIAALAERMLPKKTVVLTRSEKLLRQNRSKLQNPENAGIYCAAIGERDTSKPITFATIQSIASVQSIANQQLSPDYILIDEAHELHPDSESETQYWNFIRACGNPRIVGFTATAYRTQSGHIKWGDELANISLKMLIERGYLVPPINKCPSIPDLSKVDVKLGEYVESQLADMYMEPELLRRNVEALIQYSQERNAGIVFCQSRAHARVVTDTLIHNSITAVYVDGETPKDELDRIITDSARGKYKFIVNNNLMTTGYDLPWIDLIAIMRSTLSKALFEQMALRGTRLYEGKQNFLLLDFGGNLVKHGGVGTPLEIKPKGKEKEKPKGRICPECETYTPSIRDKECPDCGYQFPPLEQRVIDNDYEPDTDSETLSGQWPKTLPVTDVRYIAKRSKKGDDMIQVTYIHDDYTSTKEYFLPRYQQHEFVRYKFWQFLSEASETIVTDAIEADIDMLVLFCEQARKPLEIVVQPQKKNPKFTEVVRRIYEKRSIEEVLDNDFIPF